MSVWWWVVIALVVILFAFYLSSTAGRLDRLHRRIDTSELALESLLLRRSSVCLEFAGSGLLDPATSLLLADAAHAARTATKEQRPRIESELTAALAASFDDVEDVADIASTPDGAQLLDELSESCKKVELGRLFLNDAVLACRRVRSQNLVRVFRLAGRTPWPVTWEMNDATPVALAQRP